MWPSLGLDFSAYGIEAHISYCFLNRRMRLKTRLYGIPPAQIKTIVRNVIGHLIPSVDADEVRLPFKSCAAYMRSLEMPTLSMMQKATELMKSQQWHLNSDGTTLHQ